jgi:superfamily I DNA/RNA helicase/RecB family exonuclease
MLRSPDSPSLDADSDQAAVIDHSTGPLLVAGAAGTGKTTTLRRRFAELIRAGADPERVALVLGSKRARDEARRALLNELPGSLPSLRVVTIHGLAHHVVIDRYEQLDYEAPPEVLSAEDQFAKVRELLAGEDPSDWPVFGSMLGLRGFSDEVRQFLLRAQESRVRPREIEGRATEVGLTGWIELARFFERYLHVLDGQRQIDFAGLLEQATAAAERGTPAFDHVIVDDLQDFTIGGEALLVALRPTTLVAAGNAAAHVFSFQGFSDLPLRRFTTTFSGAGEIELRTIHRSGTIDLVAWRTSHSSEEHACLAREARRIHVEDEVAWDEIAIVVRRQGPAMAGLLRALDDAGVPRFVAQSGRSLLMHPATTPFVLALRWLAHPNDRDAIVEALLTSELARCSPAEARTLIRAAGAAGWPPAGALSFAEALPEPRALEVTAVKDVLARAQTVADASVLDAFAILWRELPSSARLVAAASEGAPEAAGDLDAVLALSGAVARAGGGADPSTAAFLASLEAGEDAPAPAAGTGGPSAVRVLTAHATSGQEFDTVLVADAVEGDFPSLSRPEAMFDLTVLDGPVTQSERNRRRLEEERRLFDVVASRARRRIVFAASDDQDVEAVASTRSRFVEALGVPWTAAPVAPYDDPLTVAEAQATWRRMLADGHAPPGDRLAALDGLVALDVDPAHWWYQRGWTDTGRPLREHIRVSASRLETLQNCELQFVLGEELGLDTSTSYYAWVGHTVHRIIEDCERGVVDRTLEALVDTAEARWRADQFPSLAVSEQFRRLVVDRMLPAWFREYGGQPALAAERRFEFDFEGATVAGVIDRIGRVEPRGSQITDYKTGKKRRLDADEVLQLGIYYLALHEADDLRQYLPVRGIELAFVRDVEFFDGGIARLPKAFSKDEEPEYDSRMRATLSELIGRVRTLYETGRVRPNPSANCRFCTFQPLCPLFPEGADALPEPVHR